MPSVSFNPHCDAFPMRTDEDHADAKQKQRLADMAMRIQALARGGLARGGVARSTDVCAASTAVPTQALAHGALSANRTMDSVVDGATCGASGGVVILTLNRASQRGSCNEENSPSTCSRADAKVRGAVVERAARYLSAQQQSRGRCHHHHYCNQHFVVVASSCRRSQQYKLLSPPLSIFLFGVS